MIDLNELFFKILPTLATSVGAISVLVLPCFKVLKRYQNSLASIEKETLKLIEAVNESTKDRAEIRERLGNIQTALVLILGNQILNLCQHCITKNSVTLAELNEIALLVEVDDVLGGNGRVKTLYDRVKKLPIAEH